MTPNRFIMLVVACIVVFTPGLAAHAVVEGFIPLVPETPFIVYGDATSFVGLLQALIGISVGIASVLAVVMVAIGGFQYMTTDSVFALGNARERIKDAVVGLLIVLLAVLVLRTINPDLVSLDVFVAPAAPAAPGAPAAGNPAPAAPAAGNPAPAAPAAGNPAPAGAGAPGAPAAPAGPITGGVF